MSFTEATDEHWKENPTVPLGGDVVLRPRLVAVPAEAQREYEPLFDKFNLRVEASWINLSTEIRLDSEVLGEGTTLNFEDLGLATDKTIPTLAFEWQISKRNRVGVRWQDINRSRRHTSKMKSTGATMIIPSGCHARSGLRHHPVLYRLRLLPVGQRALGGRLRSRLPVDGLLDDAGVGRSERFRRWEEPALRVRPAALSLLRVPALVFRPIGAS